MGMRPQQIRSTDLAARGAGKVRSSAKRALILASIAIALLAASAPSLAGASSLTQSRNPVSAQDLAPATDNQNGLYTLDGWGGVHPVGSAPSVAGSPSFGFDIARGLVTRSDHRSGYVLDGWGGIHPFGGAPFVTGGPYWLGWDIARGIALRADGVSGYVLDGFGGIHPFGGAPSVLDSPSWGWDIGRGIVLRPDGVSGYVLDGWGGVHPFGGAPWLAGSPYWPGWDIARALVLNTTGGGGYVLDGWGGIHPIGNSLPATGGSFWLGWDIARGMALWSTGPSTQPGGWVIDGWGGVHSFGGARVQSQSAFWLGWDIVRGLGGSNGSGGSRHYNVPPPPADPCQTGGVTYCVLNPNVTQATIYQTICVSGWTSTVRPPESYTYALKVKQIAAEGLPGGPSNYEEDHRMPLELGGAPWDVMNLSPESPPSPNPKDSSENSLRYQVCGGQLTLLQAQQQMVSTWLAAYPWYRQ